MNVGQVVAVQIGLKMKRGIVRAVEGDVIIVALDRLTVEVQRSSVF